MQAGRWRKLAELWTGGLDLDWSALGDALPGRRVSLPPVALAATQIWLDDLPPHAQDEDAAPTEDGQPGATRAVDTRLDVLSGLLCETLGLSDRSALTAADTPAALGLDSMAAIELRSRIAELCGVTVPLRTSSRPARSVPWRTCCRPNSARRRSRRRRLHLMSPNDMRRSP